MKPVDQLVLHDPETDRRGDCFRTCIACLLEVDPEEVPHVVQAHCDGGEHWLHAINAWLAGRGLTYVQTTRKAARWGACWCILSGPGPRGVDHAIVAWADWTTWNVEDIDRFHDPHPSRAGLLKIEDVGWLVPIGGPGGRP